MNCSTSITRIYRYLTRSLFVFMLTFSANLANAQDDSEFNLDLVALPTENAGLEFLNQGNGPTSVKQLREMQQVFSDLVEVVAPATVNIQLGDAQGSGVVVSRDGYVLTAAHVIGRPNKEAKITFADGSTADAMTLGVNGRFDSGILKITDKGKWPFLEIGESGSLEKGQWVMAIGHPGGLTEGRGLVYRVGRIIQNLDVYLTTDCSLVGGDSGGPLVDLNGFVIGIHSRIGSNLSDNFHVPIDMYSEEWDQLIDGVIVGSDSPYLGIELDRTGEIKNKVKSVEKHEAAAKAGMKAGDVIVQINDDKIESLGDLRRSLGRLKPRDKVKVKVLRDDEEIELEVVLGYR